MNLLAPVQRMAGAIAGIFKASPSTLSNVDERGGWRRIFDSFPGAWQADVAISQESVMAQATVFACVTLIASDIGKMRMKLVERDADGIWKETSSPAFSPVLAKPNHYQTWQKFIEQWLVSKLSHGNTYVLKQRDNRGVVVAMYVLDPRLVQPLVATDGSVYYQLNEDSISNVPRDLPAVPAREIIHDRMVCLFHPLVGVSPIFACGLSAMQGLNIQKNSVKFFANMSRPSGILTAPGEIGDESAKRLKEHWEQNFAGNNIGKVAVLGDGLKYEAMSTNAVDAQLVEQLALTAKQVASVYHVPGYMVGADTVPTSNNAEVMQIQYYSQCLQSLIEAIEALLDDGLSLVNVPSRTLGTELNLDDLLRMDSTSLTNVLEKQVKAGISKPNEARRRLNLGPVEGGDTVYMQQQNYSLSALSKRDAKEDPFSSQSSAPPAAPAEPADTDADDEAAKAFIAEVTKLVGVETWAI